MNAVEIEEAVSQLADAPFERDSFPYAFLEAFGNKATTIKKLRSGDSNKSDIPGGVLQRSNIHILVCPEGDVRAALERLRKSPATTKHKVKYILATDGKTVEAESTIDEDPLSCPYAEFADHFGFFLPLAGITTVKEIRENAFDIKATGRLNKLYIELLKANPDWDTVDRRDDLNHFFARIIFCFFAEDTGIFKDKCLFTTKFTMMSANDGSDAHEVLSELFRSMATKHKEREGEKIRSWAEPFPYVNGGLFSGSVEVPHFSKSARSYLLHVGRLDWTKINPDIFGSMIQAVADDDERETLGMHYTSVPNILKVLNPLFLDELHESLSNAGTNSRKLLNLRNRIKGIRVFDPACGSGNFLVIAYKELRKIEAEINHRRGETERHSDIPLTNFREIELRSFSAEIARLALIIAEYQCDVLYRGEKLALAEFLPLQNENWITCFNALKIDWLSVCKPTGVGVKYHSDDLFETPLDQPEMDFANEGGEIFICGNPPYKGSKWQTAQQKADLAESWQYHPSLAKTTDYVSGWIARVLDYVSAVPEATAAFVMTNSICQGQQASDIWPVVFGRGLEIRFAHLPFKWANLASHNAGVSVVIVGIGKKLSGVKKLYADNFTQECTVIGPYLVPNRAEVVQKAELPLFGQSRMLFGNMPRDGGHLFLSWDEATALRADPAVAKFVKKFIGSDELINGKQRFCLWIEDEDVEDARANAFISNRLDLVEAERLQSDAESTRQFARQPHRFVQIGGVARHTQLLVPGVSSEHRDYLPCDFIQADSIASNKCFALYDAPLWNMALIASRLHWV